MFCRFCGASVAPGSRYCSGCGKRLLTAPSARGQVLLRRLHLDTPYPYAAILFLLFAVWLLQPVEPTVDYSKIVMTLELEGESGRPDENIFRHHLSLIVENVSPDPVREIPVEFRVRVEPDREGEVLSDFLGRRVMIHRDGESLPLIIVLADLIDASERRRYTLDGIVTMEPSADITYEVIAQDTVLSSLSVPIQAPDATGSVPGQPRAVAVESQ